MATFGKTLKIDFNDDHIKELGGLADEYSAEVIKRAAFFLQGEFGENAPVDTGRLRTSFEIEGDGLTFNVFTNVVYALMVNKTALLDSKKKYIEKSILNTENKIIDIAEALFNEYF